MRTSAIAASGLRKAYGDKIVLDGIDLDVPAGTVFSLLGPNGAGKTTTVNVLTTLMKADLAMTLVGNPKIIFLDEPTTGLDPRSRRTMWDIIRELVADGVTIFLTTQYLEEADRLADRIAVLDRGHLVAQGTPSDLKRQVPGSHVRFRFTDVLELDAAARVLAGATRDDEDLTLRVPSDGGVKSVRALLGQLDAHSIEVEEFSVHTPDLDDVFLALTSHANTEVIPQ